MPDVGERVSFSVHLTDPDVGQTYTFAWDFGDGVTGSGQTPSHTYTSPGEKSVTLTVTDAPGGETSTPVTKTLRVNAPPNAAFHFEPTQPLPNQQILFTSDSTDAEGAVSLAWDLDNDGAFDDGSDVTESWSFATGGEKTVRLQVTDSDGSVRTSSRTVPAFLTRLRARASISAERTRLRPPCRTSGRPINFTSNSTDPDGNQTIVAWDWDLDGDGQFNNGSGETIQHSFATPGNKTVGLRVRDSSGETNSTTRTVRVNALPVARPSSLNPQAEPGQKYNVPLIGQPIQFRGGSVPALPGASPAPGCPASGGSPASQGSTDAEGCDRQVRVGPGRRRKLRDRSGHRPHRPAPGFPAAGDRTAVLRVTDSDGATAQTTLQFRVNTAPTAQFVFEPDTPIIGQEVTFGSTSSDPDAADSGKHTFYWDLDNDGTFCEAGETGASVKHTFQTANINPGHPVSLKVTDDGGITRTRDRPVIVQNTIPNGSISFSPDAPIPDQPVTFTGSASSPTGKAIASMEWDFNYDPSTGQFDVEATGASVVHPVRDPGSEDSCSPDSGGGRRFRHRQTEHPARRQRTPKSGVHRLSWGGVRGRWRHALVDFR